MRKLGLITDINDLITISIWDEELKKIVIKQINNQDNKEYKLLSIVEYSSETNTIMLLTDNNITKEEQLLLVNTLKVVMEDIRYQEIFFNEIDKLSRTK